VYLFADACKFNEWKPVSRQEGDKNMTFDTGSDLYYFTIVDSIDHVVDKGFRGEKFDTTSGLRVALLVGFFGVAVAPLCDTNPKEFKCVLYTYFLYAEPSSFCNESTDVITRRPAHVFDVVVSCQNIYNL